MRVWMTLMARWDLEMSIGYARKVGKAPAVLAGPLLVSVMPTTSRPFSSGGPVRNLFRLPMFRLLDVTWALTEFARHGNGLSWHPSPANSANSSAMRFQKPRIFGCGSKL